MLARARQAATDQFGVESRPGGHFSRPESATIDRVQGGRQRVMSLFEQRGLVFERTQIEGVPDLVANRVDLLQKAFHFRANGSGGAFGVDVDELVGGLELSARHPRRRRAGGRATGF